MNRCRRIDGVNESVQNNLKKTRHQHPPTFSHLVASNMLAFVQEIFDEFRGRMSLIYARE